MSKEERPQPQRQTTMNPAHNEANTSIPVTPGITDAAYIDQNPFSKDFSESLPAFDASAGTSGPQWNSNGPPDGGSGDDLLRSMSDSTRAQYPDLADVDPRSTHPGLNLSGHIISATFCVPYKIAYAPGAEWELHSRRGTSALFDSFSYLASTESPWNHTLVGWTGEINLAPPKNSAMSNGVANSSLHAHPINKASAPIPLDTKHSPKDQQEPTELRIPPEERRRLEVQLERDHGGRVCPVWLPDSVDDDEVFTLKNQQQWRRYAEHELFTLFHYKTNEPADGRALRKAWADYYRLNTAFADAIMSVFKPGDIVLVHDYHLLLLPNMLRQRVSTIYVGFFLHVPFPSSEYYRCLTRRKEVLEGMLGANMIGFQAYAYSRHFSSCCTRILGFDSSSAGVDAFGTHIAVDVFPIGINAGSALLSAFESPEVEKKVKALKELYAGKLIIVGRDRLDSVRGVAQKLQAFEIFLERHPAMRDKVVLIQVTSPTSIEDQSDGIDKTANKISDLVSRINGEYGSLSFTPVQHYPQYLPKEEYFALLRIADLGLITSVRDGMNTTALEYVVCQRDNHGPLIISEFSGTAGSLGDALHINPWDLSGTADAINIALTMTDEEKRVAHAQLYNQVTRNTVQAWTSNYLKRLLTNLSSFDQSSATPLLDRAKLLQQYRNSSRRLFMFDYDGTLTPIVKDPQAAIPSDRVIRTLKALASDPNNAVWIISGRDQAFLDEWMGHIPELGLSAEHGSFMRHPNTANWENLTETFDMSWQSKVLEVFEYYTSKTPGAFVERKKIALTWHYRRAEQENAKVMVRECQKNLEQTVAKTYDVEVMTGKANLEVRPRFVNKGEIAKKLVKAYGSATHHMPDFVLCLGDDFTDEDMFRSLNASKLNRDHVFAVTVGASNKQTLAQWHLLEPADVISAVALLNGQSDSGNVGAIAVVDGGVPESRL
ncbi:glycosyltransferase family 20 protein [Baudoinia panamericana UAMH 10762]|uniref:Glycosyltransferase family 20 protein n=1 Tax=Baudoinia panamericana (strain UAMH 10762) TaxID=717646 RepID=M2N915_BAUPA|nr:glycosyltransferase family 20 protein [Baudoinia panamericana UAMH 10762]EMC95574.1 glycosyltransferase family 20 protein [Baudoinia panamericana UAMH 10762]